jgi:hypothetical protein
MQKELIFLELDSWTEDGGKPKHVALKIKVLTTPPVVRLLLCFEVLQF